ncbi:MAG TPA: thioredoxin domain-containing protein, partial [Opitutus sp.]|nr:thioredoxin domain-containing protein [Opitutus sp.]
ATGRLSRSYRENVRDNLGFAEDYACMIQGLLDLYEATFEVRWLEWAVQLQEKQIELFADDTGGGFFANTAEDETVLLRLKEDNEGAEPSASSVSARNLLRLSELFHREDWRRRANRTAQAFHGQLQRDPLAMPQMLASMGLLEGSLKLVLVHGEAATPLTSALIREVNACFLPRRVVMRVDSQSRNYFEQRVEFIRQLPPNEPLGATVYVCENYVCQLPTSDPATLAKQLTNRAMSPP